MHTIKYYHMAPDDAASGSEIAPCDGRVIQTSWSLEESHWIDQALSCTRIAKIYIRHSYVRRQKMDIVTLPSDQLLLSRNSKVKHIRWSDGHFTVTMWRKLRNGALDKLLTCVLLGSMVVTLHDAKSILIAHVLGDEEQ